MSLYRLVTATLFIAGVAFGAAADSEGKASDVFLGVDQNDAGVPRVTFVWSRSDAPSFDPIDAMAIDIDAQRVCAVDYDASAEIATAHRETPIYGPNAEQSTIDAVRLPTYFAREAVAALLEKKLVATETDAVPYFNCVGQVWATLLSQ